MKQANYAPTIAGNGGGGGGRCGTLTTLSFPCVCARASGAKRKGKVSRRTQDEVVLFYWNGHCLVGPVQAILIGVHPRKKK